jgi:cytidine deaminase
MNMREISVNTSFKVFNSIEELDLEAKELMDGAIKARKTAYAPYSNFLVGVAYY